MKLKQGDLVMCVLTKEENFGIVVRVDDSHRQTSVNVLWPSGIEENIWANHLEIVEEECKNV